MPTKHHYEAALASKQAATPNPIAYDIPGAVQVSGQSRSGIYAAIKAGTLIARKRGYRTVILADDLRRWLESLPKMNPSRAA